MCFDSCWIEEGVKFTKYELLLKFAVVHSKLLSCLGNQSQGSIRCFILMLI